MLLGRFLLVFFMYSVMNFGMCVFSWLVVCFRIVVWLVVGVWFYCGCVVMVLVSVFFMVVLLVGCYVLMILWVLVGLIIFNSVLVGCVFGISGVVCYGFMVVLSCVVSVCRLLLLVRLMFMEFFLLWFWLCSRLIGSGIFGCGMDVNEDIVLIGLWIRLLMVMLLLVMWLMKLELVLFLSRCCIR